jgi:flagellar motility protein MotE (MotC chaperone)
MRLVLFISGCLLGGAASALAANQASSQEGLYGSSELDRPAIDGEASVASRLADKAAALAAQERTLEARSADLTAEQQRIRADIERNEAIRGELEALIENLDARHADQVREQVKVYEKMRGAQAAAVLQETDEDTALAILQGMRPDKSARVLGEMNPTRAARLTERLSAHPLSGAKLP